MGLQFYPNQRLHLFQQFQEFVMGGVQSGSSSAPVFNLQVVSGETQSQQLFDFQSENNKTQQKTVGREDIYIVQNNEGLTMADQCIIGDEVLFRVGQPHTNEMVIQSYLTSDTQLWRVIKQNQMMPIEIGDEIKIGKIKLTLKEITLKDSEIHERQETERDHSQRSFNEGDSTLSTRKEDQCRICFQKSNTSKNPLLNLCNCSGSVKYIHYECLKDWIESGVAKRQYSNSLCYTFIEPKCEICKSPYINLVEHAGKQYSLLKLDKLEPPYAVFQGLEEESGVTKTVRYLVNLSDGSEILIGRNSSCNMVMKDISVSRTHCGMQYRGGKLFIRDKNSKFGTLIKATSSLQFIPSNGIELQYESKLIKIASQKSIASCCCYQSDNFSVRFEHRGESESEKSILRDL